MSTPREVTLYWVAGSEERLHRALRDGFWDEAVAPPDPFRSFCRFRGVDLMNERILRGALAVPETSSSGLRVVLPELVVGPYELVLIPPDPSVAALGPLWTTMGSGYLLRARRAEGIPPYGRYVVPAAAVNRAPKTMTPLSASQLHQLVASQDA